MKRLHKWGATLLAFALLCVGTTSALLVRAQAATTVADYSAMSANYKASVYYENLKSVALTGNARDDIVRIALSQVGYHEGNSASDYGGGNRSGTKDYVEYNRLHGSLYDTAVGLETYGYYWCASFATWCANRAGISSSVVPTGGVAVSTERLRTWFMNNATYKTRGSYTPITGDYIFFCDSASRNTTHVGLVLYVKNGTVYTVEGNAGGYEAVALKSYSLTNDYIVGYGIPRYATGTQVNFDPSAKDRGGTYIITTEALSIRSGAGTSYQQMGAVPLSRTLTVYSVSGGWGRVDYGGVSGWISLTYAMPLSLSNIVIKYDGNGGVGAPASQTKTEGIDRALSSDVPTRDGYDFLGWATTPGAVQPDFGAGGLYTGNQSVTLYAVWQKKMVNIRFVDYNGTVLSLKTYYWGDAISVPGDPVRGVDKTFRYRFAGWTPAVNLYAQEEAVYTATYDSAYMDYTVTFQDEDGTVLSEAVYHYGDVISDVPTPVKQADETYSYTFVGWGEAVRRVEGDKVYRAVYDKNYLDYQISFTDSEGHVLIQKTYHYGETVVPPAAPEKPSDQLYDYVFLGWNRSLAQVTGHAVYTAVYARNDRMYTVRFLGGDGEVLSEQLCRFGVTPTEPETPVKAADEVYTYTFREWSRAVEPVSEDVTYEAVFEPVYVDYAVTFVDQTGHIYGTGIFHYGDVFLLPNDPVREDENGYRFVFTGWSPKASDTVTGDALYVAQFRRERADVGTGASDSVGNTVLTFGLAFVVVCAVCGGGFGIRWYRRRKKEL